jgi:hypothetical protein
MSMATRWNNLTGDFEEMGVQKFFIPMPGCGCLRPTTIDPKSKIGAAYWAYVQSRACPICRRMKHRVPFWL